MHPHYIPPSTLLQELHQPQKLLLIIYLIYNDFTKKKSAGNILTSEMTYSKLLKSIKTYPTSKNSRLKIVIIITTLLLLN